MGSIPLTGQREGRKVFVRRHRNVEVTKIDPTPLRSNPLYYKIYCVAANSLVVRKTFFLRGLL